MIDSDYILVEKLDGKLKTSYEWYLYILENKNNINKQVYEDFIKEITIINLIRANCVDSTFIVKHENELDISTLNYALLTYRFDEDIIEKHINMYNSNSWNMIVSHQKLSEKFIDKYFYLIKKYNLIEDLCDNQKLSDYIVNKYFNNIDKFSFTKILFNKKFLSKDTIDRIENIFRKEQII